MLDRLAWEEELLASAPVYSKRSNQQLFTVSDLTNMRVAISELRHAPDGTWLYALDVSCAGRRWELLKRYSEIREFWVSLCGLLVENNESCTERCHFLAGLENDKFPKKRLLHTRGVLEARANEFDLFFQKVVMRLNLCNPRELAVCHLHSCSTLAHVTSFFEIHAHCRGSGTNPYNKLPSYESMPLLKSDGRLSLSSPQEVQMQLA
ncbi:hypothetical protein Poli38472_012670 [Pythium oligandrum]|uniref:PX domain-containing protein n=1 Tax=Pythium oligandrum TaxID=41045 RepID=A0A8K1CDL5_PYTOL|nr:hypothetical protein Poli38472_012670 [Pythium oligandrum]|eukprot:TMW61479.1 hypothetical protein Poli38472_012670 [Pythium oligandrum]